jgi:hypothetical protein
VFLLSFFVVLSVVVDCLCHQSRRTAARRQLFFGLFSGNFSTAKITGINLDTKHLQQPQVARWRRSAEKILQKPGL